MNRESARGPVVAIDIGGTKIAAAVVSVDGTLSHRAEVPTPARSGAEALLDAAAALAADVAAQAIVTPCAYGVGSAGAFDDLGTVIQATDHLVGWLGTDVREGMHARLGAPVVVLNDVHAAALGEQWAGGGPERFLFVAIGTGIGGAVFTGGDVLRGASGMAGSVGHMRAPSSRGRTCACGGTDHIEAFASGPGIERTYADLGGRALDLREIGRMALDGDALAAQVIATAAAELGESLAASVVVIDPGVVVVGGGVSQLGGLFLDPLQAGMQASLQEPFAHVRVVAALSGPDAALLGAGKLAFGGA